MVWRMCHIMLYLHSSQSSLYINSRYHSAVCWLLLIMLLRSIATTMAISRSNSPAPIAHHRVKVLELSVHSTMHTYCLFVCHPFGLIPFSLRMVDRFGIYDAFHTFNRFMNCTNSFKSVTLLNAHDAFLSPSQFYANTRH